MKTLSDFKRYLATENAAIRLDGIETYKDNEWVAGTVFNADFRTVAKVQTNSVALVTPNNKSGKSWLDFGKASDWVFDAEAKTAVNTSSGTRLTYTWV